MLVATIRRMKRAVKLSFVVALLAVLGIAGLRAQESAAGEVLTKEQFTAALLERLSLHEYFADVEFEQRRDFDPLLFLAPKTAPGAADFGAAAVAERGPRLRATAELFRKQYVEPLALKRRGDQPLNAFIVLRTFDDYARYAARLSDTTPNSGFAHFDRRLRTVVAFESGSRLDGARRNEPETAEFVRELLQSHYDGVGGEVAQSWIYVGLGNYLAHAASGDAKAGAPRVIDELDVEFIVALLRDPSKGALYLLPLEEIVALDNDDVWSNAVRERARTLGVDQVDAKLVAQAWSSQSALWMHFLHDGNGAKHRADLLAYLASALHGLGGAADLRAAFHVADLGTLDREFYAWLAEHYSAVNPKDRIDPEQVSAPRALPKLAATSKAKGAAPAAAAALDARALTAPLDDPAAAHARIVQQIRDGHLEEALAALLALQNKVLGGPIAPRLEREFKRLKGWTAMRDRYFADVIANGTKLLLNVESKKLVVKVERVENGSVFFADNRLKLASLPLCDFKPADTARELPKALVESSDGWIRFYPLVLEGDAKLKLSGDAPQLGELRADAAEWYPGVVALGRVLGALDALAAAGVPTDPATATKCIERLRALKKDFGATPQVLERAALLRQLAAVAAEKQFTPSCIAAQFAGKLEFPSEGRAKVTYAFDTPKELDDFVRQEGYMTEWSGVYEPIRKPAADSKLTLSGGALRGDGELCYRLALPFKMPVSARYKFKVGSVPKDGSGISSMMVAVCDNGEHSYIGCEGLGIVTSVDVSKGQKKIAIPKPEKLTVDKEYSLELRVANKRVTSLVDGAVIKEISSGALQRGEILVAIHSDAPYAITHLEVEGDFDIATLRARWIEALAAGVGF